MARQSEQSGGPSTFTCETRAAIRPVGWGTPERLEATAQFKFIGVHWFGAARNFLSLSQSMVCLRANSAALPHDMCPVPTCMRSCFGLGFVIYQ
jgi:hypothetical protein